MTNGNGVTRRQFVVGAGAAGALAAMPLLGRNLSAVFAAGGPDEVVDGVGTFGEETPANRLVYTTCEQCNTFCTIKVGLTDPAATGGVAYARKIAGNPYSPLSSVPFGQIDYATDPTAAAAGHGDLAEEGRSFRGGRSCLKGQAGIQTAYDQYRLAKPLKRVGPRGSGQWISLEWEQALSEIATALKPTIGWAPKATVMADWEKVKAGKLTQAEFDAKYADVLIDTRMPDLGPKVNQIAFLNGNRPDFMTRMTASTLGCINFFDHGGICGSTGVIANVRTHNGNQARKRQYADIDA
ncbi:MAG TPA: hypothetical protein VNT75_27975, partial [Symbiobacteriaceae bacterium]|nr:hypothetical protein [Symbiobacteriaceae bacterium]